MGNLQDPPTVKRDWSMLAEHFLTSVFPEIGPRDSITREQLLQCVAEAMEQAIGFELPEETRGDWVAIVDVPLGSRVVAPYNKGIGYMVGTVKADPYGSGKRVVSNGEGFVTPESVKLLLQVVGAAAPGKREGVETSTNEKRDV